MSKPLYTEVHSPHVLNLFERAALEQAKLDPADFIGINFNMSAMGFLDAGTHFMFLVQIPFGKGIFPDLSRPAILGPAGQQQVPKTFDKGLGMPPYFRMVIKPSILDRPIRRSIEDLLALEGQSLDDPEIRTRWQKANNPQRDGTPRFNLPKEGDPVLPPGALAGAAAQARVGDEARVKSVDDIERGLNEALGEDGPKDAGDQ